jgi:hypothetical protein
LVAVVVPVTKVVLLAVLVALEAELVVKIPALQLVLGLLDRVLLVARGKLLLVGLAVVAVLAL